MPRALPNFALVSAPGLGDALLFMILSHNLTKAGYSATTFSSLLCELKEWFPGQTILPFPAPEQVYPTFSSFDTVVAADHSMVSEKNDFGNHFISLKEKAFIRSKTMVINLTEVCQKRLHLPHADGLNGITPPRHLTWRKIPKRVVIHPSSSTERKNWSWHQFLELSQKLEAEGFETFFTLSRDEYPAWKGLIDDSKLPFFKDLSETAAFIYESGFLIGNDSGPGHLASALHIPTLSLFARKGYSRLWRPGWGPGVVVAPSSFIPATRYKEKNWRRLLSVNKVFRAFQQLVERENSKR